MSKHLLLLILLGLTPLKADPQQPVANANPSSEKRWYEFVFFSPLVSGVVVSGIIGWILLRKGEDIKNANSLVLEQNKRHLDSLKAYQDEARSLQAPALEAYNRLRKLESEAPRIEDNKILIEYLDYVLEPYSRFRVAYTESFRVSTNRYCPEVAKAFDYISDDFCNIIIYVSSDVETRRSEERQALISRKIERLKHNIDCIEANLTNLMPTAAPPA